MTALERLLEDENALLRNFVEVLAQEQEALKLGDIDPLPELNARKAELVAKLDDCEAARNRQLNAAGHAPDRSGMDSWLAGPQANALTAKKWEQFLELAAEARRLNDLNGQLIALRLQATSDAIDTLTARARSTSLYGPDGQQAPSTGRRVIDAA